MLFTKLKKILALTVLLAFSSGQISNLNAFNKSNIDSLKTYKSTYSKKTSLIYIISGSILFVATAYFIFTGLKQFLNNRTNTENPQIENNAQPYTNNTYQKDSLCSACLENNLNDAQFLLNNYAEAKRFINTSNNGFTPLCCACSKKNFQLAKLLIDNGASTSIPDGNGNTPLSIAYTKNNLKLLELFIKNDTSMYINTPDKNGRTPLCSACLGNNIELTKLLLDNGASTSIPDDNGDTPLCLACLDNNIELAKLLIDNGASKSINIPNYNGKTPLSIACMKNNLKLLELFIKNDAKKYINTPDKDGNTLLYKACLMNNLELTRLLLNNGADIKKNEIIKNKNFLGSGIKKLLNITERFDFCAKNEAPFVLTKEEEAEQNLKEFYTELLQSQRKTML